MMESTLASKMEAFREEVTKKGEEITFQTFPTKILELNSIIQTINSPDSPFHLSHTTDSTDGTVYPAPTTPPSSTTNKKRKLLNNAELQSSTDSDSSPQALNDTQCARLPSLVRSNQHLTTKLHDVIKQESEQLAILVDQVKLWVTLTMPKIEDGDNFGVQIQEEVLAELHRAQESAHNLRDGARQDHLARAKICSKLIKYPNVEDYTLSLKEHDEKQAYLARQHLLDIRNLYAVLTDMIHKNITKIRAPKANNSVGLY